MKLLHNRGCGSRITPMHISDFSYNLPEQKIATHPPRVRGSSKLLVLNRKTGQIEHDLYKNFVNYVESGDVVVLNDTKVIKARLIVHRDEKKREFLLLERHSHVLDTHHWKVLYRGKIKVGETYTVDQTEILVEEVLDGGLARISSSSDLLELSNRSGSVPLPPYIKRSATPEDIERYQTEFARSEGSVAAPTASLNFTEDLIERLTTKGVEIAYLTLHVGLGTFLPIRTDEVEKHEMHSEYFEIPASTAIAIKQAKDNSKRVFAVGTTVTRTLEYANEQIVGRSHSDITGEADIFIYPGYKFKVVDGLLTNFHAPKTTVLMLAATFAGWNNLKQAYDSAIELDYKLLSYGDSMLIR